MKELPLTPLMTISLTLPIGIIIAPWGYDDSDRQCEADGHERGEG